MYMTLDLGEEQEKEGQKLVSLFKTCFFIHKNKVNQISTVTTIVLMKLCNSHKLGYFDEKVQDVIEVSKDLKTIRWLVETIHQADN